MQSSKNRVSLALILVVILAFFTLFSMTGAAVEKSGDFFPVSVWYGGGKARAPMLETASPENAKLWKKDLEQIKSLGFNTIRCWVEWTANEKEEGKYDFSTLRTLVNLAGQVGLRVIIQVYIDSAPDWVGRKYPDSKFVASNGLAVESQASPGFCFDHPKVREKILRFFAEAARVVKDQSAFLGWDLWSEPHIINWAEIYHLGNPEYLQFCYCPSSLGRFREWLKNKYQTLENLNKAWYRTFRSWEEADPPRFGTILTYTDYIDWKNYISDKLAEDLAMKAQAVREVVPRSVITSHSATPGLFTKPVWSGTPDDRKMARVVDYYGVSIYPKHAWTTKPWSPFFRASGHDFVRSMNLENGGFYIGELQAGYGVFGMKLSVPVVGDDLRDWMWSSIAYGARAVNIYAYYPMNSGYEAGGYGLVELDGRVTERAVAAGKIARLVTENKDIFLKSRPPSAKVAILYNPLSHMIGGQQPFTGEGQSIGSNSLSESLQGIHKAFFEQNMPVDFLHVMDLRPERLSQYKLLIVPYPVMMSKPDLQKLMDYVKGGGTLVAEARCGWIDERGFSSDIIPGGGMHEVFGCRESYLMPLARMSTLTIKSSHESLPLLKPGDKLDTVFFEEGFELLGDKGRVLAEFENGKPAIVYASYGKGRAIIAGSFLGSAYYHFKNPANGRFFAGLFDWLRIQRSLEVVTLEKDALVEGRMLEGKVYKILFAFNRGIKKAGVKLGLPAASESLKAWELESKKDVAGERAEGKTFWKKALAPSEIWVLVVEQK